MKNLLTRFLKAFLRRVNFNYAQITLKTLFTQNTPDDRKKNYIFGLSYWLSNSQNYYCLILLSQFDKNQKAFSYKPDIFMRSGLQELSKKRCFIYEIWVF